jgi:hypothetical protein
MIALLMLIPGVGPFLAFAKVNRWVWKVLAVVGLLLVLTALWFGLQAKGRHDQRVKDQAAASHAIDQAKAINAAATGHSDAERTQDTAAVVAMKKDLTDAYAETPDSVPDGARLRLSCERLRNTPQARLPEFSRICGHEGAGQAPAQH